MKSRFSQDLNVTVHLRMDFQSFTNLKCLAGLLPDSAVNVIYVMQFNVSRCFNSTALRVCISSAALLRMIRLFLVFSLCEEAVTVVVAFSCC